MRGQFVVLRLALVIFNTAPLQVLAYNNSFNGIPSTFPTTTTKPIEWSNTQGTYLMGLWAMGDTDTTEELELPLSDCRNSTLINDEDVCLEWQNNGTASFGGPYAAGLNVGNMYHFELEWISTIDQSTSGTTTSDKFLMADPNSSSSSSAVTTSSSSTSSMAASSSPGSTLVVVMTSTSGVAASTNSSIAEATSESSSDSKPQSSSITVAGEVGLAFGVAAFVVFSLMAGFLLYKRRKAVVSPISKSSPNSSQIGNQDVHEIHSKGSFVSPSAPGICGSCAHSMKAETFPPNNVHHRGELPATMAPQELDDSSARSASMMASSVGH